MESIKLSDLLNACYEFKENPTDILKEKALQDILNNMVVKTYQPLLKKEMAVISILSVCKADEAEADLAMDIEVGKIYYGLLPYVVNLLLDIDLDSFVFPLIDLLYETDVINWILQYCKEDYERVEKMLDRAINFSNIERIVNIPALTSDEKLTEVIEAIKDFKKELTPELLKSINAIALESAPEWRAFKETVAEKVYSDLNEQMLWEAENSKNNKALQESEDQDAKGKTSTEEKPQ